MQLADRSEPRVGVPPLRAQLSAWLEAARIASVRLLRAGAVVPRNGAASASEAKVWTETLGRVIADLDLLNHNTEQDFLRIGGKLAEFIEAVNLISSELTALAALISGEHGLRASQALTDALKRSTEIGEHSEEGNRALGGMRQEAGRLKQTLAGFQGTVTTLHTLGVLTQIETARLGSSGADFGNLADEVKALAGSVQGRVESALDTAALLIPPIERAMQSISALEEGQTKDLPSVISGVLAGLASFRDIQTGAHDSSVRLRTQYGAISDAFKKLIVSLQFHDITRQQVEHVIEVLRRLCSESKRENGGISRGQQGSAAVLALQSSQLADAGQKFAASAASVAHNLDDIAMHVLEMAGESRKLSGLSEDEKNSFFLQMEQGCATILASLSRCADAEAATQVTGGGLGETIGRMHGAIEEIRAIEIQMQRMALNASIRAAHIGASGDALSVLAGSMQQRALESRQRSESLLETLGSMSETATRLSRQGGSASASEDSNPDRCFEELRVAVEDLHSSSERSFAQIGQIIACGARLREDLSATRESFTVGALFAEAVTHAQAMLKAIGEKNPSALSPDRRDVLDLRLADFAVHYTMQAERDVHAGITKAVVEAAPVAVGAEAEELGENVEFF
jgi:methyl-accepting chemotaxis protein